jgi:hypothetical protein
MEHSKVVGGSTAKRVMNCPGSVALCAKMPPQKENEYMVKGTLCHNAMDRILSTNIAPRKVIGMAIGEQVLDAELYEGKVRVALALLDEIDPAGMMEIEPESRVGFGDLLPGVFGTTDVIGKLDGRAVVLDWKFGDGVPVDAEENAQLMFYAAAAMRTASTQWAFQDADEVELIIVQPPHVRRWTTTIDRIMAFEADLVRAVKLAQTPDAPLKHGDHCRFCTAKPVCPLMTGAVDRALEKQIADLDVGQINAYLRNADILESWISDLRALAFQMLEKGVKLPDWKLVAKRGTRKWTKEQDAKAALLALGVAESEVTKTELLSPAQAEKVLKKHKLSLPEEVVVSVSSGSTLASADDARPEVLQIGNVLTNALSKLS